MIGKGTLITQVLRCPRPPLLRSSRAPSLLRDTSFWNHGHCDTKYVYSVSSKSLKSLVFRSRRRRLRVALALL